MPKPTHLFTPAKPRPRWLKALLFTLALPPCALGLFCLLTAYKNLCQQSGRSKQSGLRSRCPQSGQRLLVFAPHPDDETLGAAGLMRRGPAPKGDEVHVVIITNGDGFRISAAQEFHELNRPCERFCALWHVFASGRGADGIGRAGHSRRPYPIPGLP